MAEAAEGREEDQGDCDGKGRKCGTGGRESIPSTVEPAKATFKPGGINRRHG